MTHGRKRSAEGFGNRFREWCDAAGVFGVSAHGLRKSASRRLAEAGCTTKEIMAITGHTTLAEVERYARSAEQGRLAASAIKKLKRTERNRKGANKQA